MTRAGTSTDPVEKHPQPDTDGEQDAPVTR